MKKILSLFAASVVLTAGAFAADLTVDSKFDFAGKDIAGAFLTFKGHLESVDKSIVDATTGASTGEATKKWNLYQPDAAKKDTFPKGVQSLLKYGVSPAKQVLADAPTAVKAADGTITIQYLHRGNAYKIVTDKTGKIVLPLGDYKLRKIGYIDTNGVNFISKDFSKDGTVATIDWKKVWDASAPDGNVINDVATQKTGKIVDDKGASENSWTGALQVTLNGTILTVKGALTRKD